MTDAVPLDHVVARNLRELLEERAWRHVDLATAMRALGMDWTVNRVAQVVTLRRTLSLLEVAALCMALGVKLDRLLAGDDVIGTPNFVKAADMVRAARSNKPVVPTGAGARFSAADISRGLSAGKAPTGAGSHEPDARPDDVESLVARRLGVSVEAVRAASSRLYGTPSVRVVRESMAGDITGLTATAVRAKRGHAMRAILADLSPEVTAK